MEDLGRHQRAASYHGPADVAEKGLKNVAVTKTEIRKVITKLDGVRIELLRLRAQLLPEERPAVDERRKIRQALNEIESGQSITLRQLQKELGV